MAVRCVILTVGILLAFGCARVCGQLSPLPPTIEIVSDSTVKSAAPATPPRWHLGEPFVLTEAFNGTAWVPVKTPEAIAAFEIDPTKGLSARPFVSLPLTGLDSPGQQLGWYADAEIGILKPNLKTRLTTPSSFATPIAIPSGSLDWTVAPELYLGYRLDQGAGELRLSYRLVASSGHDTLVGPDPAASAVTLATRLNLNVVDFDYISPEFLPRDGDTPRAFLRELRGGVGVRAVSAFFDTRAVDGNAGTDSHVSSTFGGVGLKTFFGYRQDLGRPDVQFYSRLTASGVVGPIRQKFSQESLTGGVPAAAFFDTNNRNTGMGTLQAEAGVSWTPATLDRRLRLTAAYSWERWWNFGRTDNSNAELTLQGLLLRAEYKY